MARFRKALSYVRSATYTAAQIEEMRRAHDLPPVCPHCEHDRWTYQIRHNAFSCQRHREFFLDRNVVAAEGGGVK
ncbi:MAG: hypothetical protein EPN91_06600 [Salinibacterium sp.]|nr:MAG: hypothetical protein EPN91_06600 [Salinibacterium sp.]